jgi:NADPH:quinone reductase-like Zn-dependent oxidoreductase
MKAYIQRFYGGPEKLTVGEIERPKPKPNEVLVKVYTSSINPLDWHFMRGTPYFMRLITGLFRPRAKVIGSDLAGIVEEPGSGIKTFKKGDRVFGGHRVGAYAEYCVVAEDKLQNMPDELSFKDAAAIPIAGITALQALRDHGKVKEGDDVLINGSSGGVGSFGLQLAKLRGAIVTAVCSASKIEQALELNADHIIDYGKADFTKQDKKYDHVMDNVGNKTPSQLRRVLKAGGTAGIVGYGGPGKLIKAMLARKGVSMINTSKTPEDLSHLAQLVVEGKIKVIHDLTYPFKDLPEAMHYVEQGHAKGKVVIEVV